MWGPEQSGNQKQQRRRKSCKITSFQDLADARRTIPAKLHLFPGSTPRSGLNRLRFLQFFRLFRQINRSPRKKLHFCRIACRRRFNEEGSTLHVNNKRKHKRKRNRFDRYVWRRLGAGGQGGAKACRGFRNSPGKQRSAASAPATACARSPFQGEDGRLPRISPARFAPASAGRSLSRRAVRPARHGTPSPVLRHGSPSRRSR